MTYAIETWFERDRAYVGLYYADDSGRADTNGPAIIEWWDEEVSEAIEDGFLDPRDYIGSAFETANNLGIIHIEDCAKCGREHDVNAPNASNTGARPDDGLPLYYCQECTEEMLADLEA